jgi:hypothetical protein
MGSPNVVLAEEYLRAVASMRPSDVTRVYSADIEFHKLKHTGERNG